MTPKSVMLIAGETSGDNYAANLVEAIRAEWIETAPAISADYQPLETSLAPRFFGAGGPRMAAAGVELAFDMTHHSVIGLVEALRQYRTFRRLFRQLVRLARDREPVAVVCVDFAGFNRRLAAAIRQFARARQDWFHNWNPRLVQYVSPQVWASREDRVYQLARDYDVLLSIFPFEKQWYARRVPGFRVEFVGHPMMDYYHGLSASLPQPRSRPCVVLLPGSRRGEIARHLPVMIGALGLLRRSVPELRALMVVPEDRLLAQTKGNGLPADLEIQIGNLPAALSQAHVAIAKTGTITMDCAYFGVPTVTMYMTSTLTWQVAKRIVRVKYASMPNLLEGEEVFPEFIQEAATAENIAQATLQLLRDDQQRTVMKLRLARIISKLGGPGASRRAAKVIVDLIRRPS